MGKIPRAKGRSRSKTRKRRSQQQPATKKAARAAATKRPGLTEVRGRINLEPENVRE
jgi:hypothetical protein